jgi:repressor of nif and glnA expression
MVFLLWRVYFVTASTSILSIYDGKDSKLKNVCTFATTAVDSMGIFVHDEPIQVF